MNSGTQARADWRALISAAFIGSGVGLALGGIYLGAGMSQAAQAHGHAEQFAQVGQALRGPLAADPVVHAVLPGAPTPAAAEVEDAKPTRARELDCLTQAVYFEARGESQRGQQAVATVIMNRVKNPHFPKTVCGVVYQGASHHGCQFSFACDGQAERVREWTAWERARQVAGRVLAGAVLRDVGSATHFHTTGVAPEWGGSMLRVAQVGLHVFYRLNPHAKPPQDLDDQDDPPQFASRAASAPTQLRLAAAVVAPAAEPTKPAIVAVEGKPAAKAVEPASSISKTDAPATPKPETATPS